MHTSLSKFQKFLDANEIENFSAKEVLFRGASDIKLQLNSNPPESMWENIIPTLKALDIVRNDLNVPIQLLSIYRNPAYNRAIGGVSNSQHVRFRACDVISPKANPRTICTILRDIRKDGVFRGGLGLYRGFVHIDTRGSNATWAGKAVTI